MAFGNVWRTDLKEELSVDLMRYRTGAPEDVMQFLLVRLMLWAKEHGYEWFNLGMAPLSGVEARPAGPLWNRIAALAYQYGEHFYNFQGLRQYKEKFHPVWTPRYLASPGGLTLPRILTNLVTLISGGFTELLRK
jgi:phosphatidylglycerol lysyltransferase